MARKHFANLRLNRKFAKQKLIDMIPSILQSKLTELAKQYPVITLTGPVSQVNQPY